MTNIVVHFIHAHIQIHRGIRNVRCKLHNGLHRCKTNFDHVATIWKSLIERRHKNNNGAAKELIPCELSEDETGIVPMLEYDEETDSVMGSCGWRNEDHQCDPDFAPVIGDDWDNLIFIMKNCVAATYARVIMVNPCVPFLKPAVVFASCTCNKFRHHGHRGDVVSQWDATLKCFDEYLTPLGLFFTGRGSDGDGRRYLLQHATWLRHTRRLRKLTIAVRRIQRFWRDNRHIRPNRNENPTRVLSFSGSIPISLSSMTADAVRGFTFACLGTLYIHAHIHTSTNTYNIVCVLSQN